MIKVIEAITALGYHYTVIVKDKRIVYIRLYQNKQGASIGGLRVYKRGINIEDVHKSIKSQFIRKFEEAGINYYL